MNITGSERNRNLPIISMYHQLGNKKDKPQHLEEKEEAIMSKKDDQSQQALKSETSRRTFLKTSAAAAGAALVGAAVKASPASAATKTKSKGTTSLKTVVARPDLYFYPGEELASDEMRVTILGSGWGSYSLLSKSTWLGSSLR